MQIFIEEEDPLSDDAISLMDNLSTVLKEITGDSGNSSFNIDDLKKSKSFFLIARNQTNVALGCGSVRQLKEKVGEIKRMYSKAPGIGTEILQELEKRAIKFGYEILKLETRKVNEKAVEFYLKNNYQIINNYGKYIGREDAICFQKVLKKT